MKLAQLKKDLKQVGVDFEEVKREIEKDGQDIAPLIRVHDTPDEVLIWGFDWGCTARGDGYWRGKYEQLLDIDIIAPAGEVCDYPVRRRGNTLVVNSLTITPDQQKAMFKLLADHLGYEIQE